MVSAMTVPKPLRFTASGPDRSEAPAELAGALTDAGIDIVGMREERRDDTLTLSFLLALGDDPVLAERLRTAVFPRAVSLGLTAELRRPAAGREPRRPSPDRLVLTVAAVTVPSRPVAAVIETVQRHHAAVVGIRGLTDRGFRAGEFLVAPGAASDPVALRDALLREVEALGLDAGLAPEAAHRRGKRLVVFDMDGTLVEGEVIDRLAREAGVEPAVAAVTSEAMEGRLDFRESLLRRVALLAGLPETVLDRMAGDPPVTPGAEETLAALRARGCRLAVVSGGFTPFTEVLKRRLHLDHAYANTLEVAEGKLTGRVLGEVLDGAGKARCLEEMARAEGVPLDQVAAVGDGANDVPMLQAAGLGVAFRAKDVAGDRPTPSFNGTISHRCPIFLGWAKGSASPLGIGNRSRSTDMELGLEGKVALVAGASAGIGYGAAAMLAREGARVVLASRDLGRIEAAAERIRAAGGEATGLALDVTDPDAGERFVASAGDAFGPPEILVTNAGGPAGGGFDTLTAADFEAATRLSFLSAVNLTRAALPAMKNAGWGRIVHISSATIIEPNDDLFLSSAVRPAVAGFSKALAREVAPLGITVNLVCPGYIATERLKDLAARRAREAGTTEAEAMEAMSATVPAGRIGRVEELASAICFLCGEPASYVTGVALRVDGGKVAFLL